VNVTPSVPDLPLTLPLGSALTSGQVLTVWNTPGANPYAFTMLGTLVPPNSGLLVQWTGTQWIPLNTFRNPGVYVVDGVTILNIGAAYSLCTGAGTLTPAGCQIWDYNLQAGEVMNSLPWSNTGSEVPIELHLGPGKLKICDTTSCAQSFSFTVPRLSRVIGSGRQNTGSTVGTAIVAGSNFGPGNLSSAPGGELTVIAGQPSFSTSGCGSSPTVTISPPGAPGGTTATVTPIVSGGSILSLEVTNPGSGYNANPTASISPCTGSITFSSANLAYPLVIVGDLSSAAQNFGSRLENLTVDCNGVTGCIAVEGQNVQEQGGVEHVSAVNYHRAGIFWHGTKTNNSHFFDIEALGCTSVVPVCPIDGTTTPINIANSGFRGIDGATINYKNNLSSAGVTPSSGSCAPGTPSMVTLSLTGSNPFTPGEFIINSGYMPSPYNGVFGPISTTSSTVVYVVSGCSGAITVGKTLGIPAHGLVLCSGTACGDGGPQLATTGLIAATHHEDSGDGIYVTGPATHFHGEATTCNNGGTLVNCIHIDGNSATQPNVVAALGVTTSPNAVAVQDDILGMPIPADSQGILAEYFGGTSVQRYTAGLTIGKRYTAHLGTALAMGNFSLSSGWGTSPSLSFISGTDQAFTFTVTAGTSPSAHPTITLTFADSAWLLTPIYVCTQNGTTGTNLTPPIVTPSTTNLILLWNPTPVAGDTYTFVCIGMGT